jgi:anti-sigma factor RsiW
MCPDPQLLSIYMDGELPSPWKEKMEAHLAKCSVCKSNYDNFKKLQGYFKKDHNQRRTIVERGLTEDGKPEELNAAGEPEIKEHPLSEYDFIEKSKEKVWRNLEHRSRRHYSVWQRRLSVPLSAVAAAAAVVIVILTLLYVNGAFHRSIPDSTSKTNFILASEEELPDLVPVADMNGVLQYLGVDSSDTLIIKLPESRNFLRSGEPAIIRAADYQRR